MFKNLIGVAVFGFAGLILAGCDGTSSGTEATGGVGGQVTGGAGGSVSCAYGEYCGVPVASMPYNGDANPCNAYMSVAGGTEPGAWDVQAQTCWAYAPWCESSVSSTASNAFGYTYGTNIASTIHVSTYVNRRPVSARCAPGVKTYIFAPGTLMGWGDDFPGSLLINPTTPTSPGYVGTWATPVTNDGYKCVVNTSPVLINC